MSDPDGVVRKLEDPQIRILLALREELQDELEQLRERVDKLEDYLNILSSYIGTSSFTTADTAASLATTAARTAPATKPKTEVLEGFPRTIAIMNKARTLELGTLKVTEDELVVTPANHAIYDIKLGAFAKFFVERILGNFQQEDRHRVENGELEWEDAFDFELRAEDSVLQEIIIRNWREESRLTEIQRTLRWALEKTYAAR